MVEQFTVKPTTAAKQTSSPKTIAVYPISNFGGYEIYECNDERVHVGINNGDTIVDCGTRQVKYTSSGRPYFNLGGQRHYIDDFIRI